MQNVLIPFKVLRFRAMFEATFEVQVGCRV